MVRTKQPSQEGPRRGPIGPGNAPKPRFPIQRTEIWDNKVKIFGWPSHGGVIVLDNATLVDLDFLGWDTVNPPLKRDRDQDAEDRVCQRLLLLGATWFDSQERHDIIAAVEDDFDPLASKVEIGEVPRPTKMERRWVRVGWPSHGGGLWVAEFDNHVFGPPWQGPGLPDKTAHLLLARNMNEKCEILQQLGGQFLANLEEYRGAGCLNAWNNKETGEVGPLVITTYVEW